MGTSTVNAASQAVGFSRRGLAILLDCVLLSICVTAVSIVVQNVSWLETIRPYTTTEYEYLAWGAQAALVILVLYCWVRFEGTPGKLLMGCHIKDKKTGKAPGLSQAFIRFLTYLVSLLPLGLGFLWVLWDKNQQSFHDKLANTVVVEEDESEKTVSELMAELR